MEPVTKQNLIDFSKEVKSRLEHRHNELNEFEGRCITLRDELSYLDAVLDKIHWLIDLDQPKPSVPMNQEEHLGNVPNKKLW